MTTTLERIQTALADNSGCGVKRDAITLEASFRDDLGMDSLDEVQSVMSLEEEFGIEITDDEAQALLTVRDAVKLIDKRLAA